MHEWYMGLASFLLLNVIVGLIRVLRGPTPADCMLAASAWRFRHQWAPFSTLQIPSGDLLITVDWSMSWLQRCWHSSLAPAMMGGLMTRISQLFSSWKRVDIGVTLIRMEGRLGRWANAGLLFLFLVGVFFATLLLASGNKGR